MNLLRPCVAVDLWLGELARAGKAERTRDDYRRKLDVLLALTERQHIDDVREITSDHCRQALDRWNGRAPGTIAHGVSVYSGFFRFLYLERRIEVDPMERIQRPRQLPAAELDVVTVNANDVQAMLANCTT